MINIAIDGPAGAGKSTVAKGAAKKLGYIYVDTGALYRTIALACTRENIDLTDEESVKSVVSKISVRLGFENGVQKVYLLDEDVSEKIRTPEISMAASLVSKVPYVRSYLLDLQRDIAKNNNILMDGRDIATVVLPDADVKIFLFASPECRADRRYKELVEKGENVDYNDVLDDIVKRDYQDSHRDIAPLKPAEDSVMFDTSNLGLQESIDKLIEIVEEKLNERV